MIAFIRVNVHFDDATKSGYRENMTLCFPKIYPFPSFVVLATAFAVCGCAGRPGPDALTSISVSAPEGAKQVRIFAMTTRARAESGKNIFTTQPSFKTSYASFDVSTPPNHKPGHIEWPTGKPDPAKSFVVRHQDVFDREEFYSAVKHAAGSGKSIGFFVHGYNTNFPEALYRLTQMSVDSNIDGVPILFAWPSQGTVSGYVADKEAVTYSRDDLASALIRVSKINRNKDTLVFAHSMGSWLLMESLRQLKLSGHDDILARLKIVLAAPDIDANVFRTQLTTIGKLPKPITILVAKDDRALKVSSLLTAESRRLGALDVSDPEVVATARLANVQIVDISNVESEDSFKHSRYASMVSVLPQLEKGRQGNSTIGRAGAYVFSAAGDTIASPFKLVGQVIGQ